jgi:hypothetical protein
MIGLEPLRWLLTLVFAGTTAFHLVRSLRPGAFPPPSAEHRFSEVLHLLMGASMIVMIWPWGRVVPVAGWVSVFTVCTGWFAARAVRSTGRRIVPVFFATSMGVMVWMGASMPADAASGPGAAPMTDMPGMVMAGPHGLTAWVSGALGGYLVLAAFWWIFRGARVGTLAGARSGAGAVARPRPVGWTAVCHGLMSAGMGLALLTMA